MQLTPSTSPTSHPVTIAILLLLATLYVPSVLSQTFSFTRLPSPPFAPRTGFPTALAPCVVAPQTARLYLFGGSDGRTDNDVWLSTSSGTDWSILSGRSTAGNSTVAADASFPPTELAQVACDPVSSYFFHYGGLTSSANGTAQPATDTWYSTDAITWRPTVYTDGSPQPEARLLPGSLVTTSNTERDVSFLLVGGGNTPFNATASSFVWKSTATVGKPDVRQWTPTGSTLDAGGAGFVHLYSAVLMDRGRLAGKDILYVMGGVNHVGPAAPAITDAIWVSSDEGATWARMASRSFGARYHHSAAVTDDGILFVLGGLARQTNVSTDGATSLTDLWASFDGGYTWSLCSDTLPARDRASMTYDPFSSSLLYGMGFNTTITAPYLSVMNDLYSADVSNAAAVAAMCGATVPAAGVGLKSWPFVGSSSSTAGAVGSSSSITAGAGGSSSSSSTAGADSGGSSNTGVTAESSSSSYFPPSSTSSSSPSNTAAPTAATSTSSSSSSSSSTTGTDTTNTGSSSSSNAALLTTFIIIFAALTVACAALAYTQYRLRVYGTACCEWCAGVSCGQLCGETVGWGTKWQRRSNLSDADLLRQVATDRYD